MKKVCASNLDFFDFVVTEKRKRSDTQWFDFRDRRVQENNYKDWNKIAVSVPANKGKACNFNTGVQLFDDAGVLWALNGIFSE